MDDLGFFDDGAYGNNGNIDAAIKALERSLEIDPSQEAAHVALQAIYQARGDLARSQYHAGQATANRQLQQRLTEGAKQQNSKQKSATP